MEKKFCAIVKLKAKINGHKATIAEDYQDLKEIVMDKRREENVAEVDSEQTKNIRMYVLTRIGQKV